MSVINEAGEVGPCGACADDGDVVVVFGVDRRRFLSV